MLLRRYHKRPIEKPKKEEVSLSDLTVKELREKAKDKDIVGYSTMKKEELIETLEG